MVNKCKFPSCETCNKDIYISPNTQVCYDARHKYPSECPKDIWYHKYCKYCNTIKDFDITLNNPSRREDVNCDNPKILWMSDVKGKYKNG